MENFCRNCGEDGHNVKDCWALTPIMRLWYDFIFNREEKKE